MGTDHLDSMIKKIGVLIRKSKKKQGSDQNRMIDLCLFFFFIESQILDQFCSNGQNRGTDQMLFRMICTAYFQQFIVLYLWFSIVFQVTPWRNNKGQDHRKGPSTSSTCPHETSRLFRETPHAQGGGIAKYSDVQWSSWTSWISWHILMLARSFCKHLRMLSSTYIS